MKLFKKIVALTAMAAVCFAMAAPVSASAAATCPPHFYTEINHRVEIVDSETHEIIYYADKNNDGVKEIYKENCVIEMELYIHDKICYSCGSIMYRISSGSWPAHRNMYCEDYAVG